MAIAIQPSDVDAVLGDIDSKSSVPARRTDWATPWGMAFLYSGIAVSMAMLFFPVEVQNFLRAVFGALHVDRFGITAVGIQASTVAQSLWFTGAILLCVQPLKTQQWSFLVSGISIVLASLLPLLGIGSAEAILLRIVYTGVVMLWLGSLEGMGLCRAVLPWHWLRVWRGELGGTALAIVASEILSWGYSLFAVSNTAGWVCLVVGSLVMMRFGYAGMQKGVDIAVAWYRLNFFYVVMGIIQLLWLLKAFIASFLG